MTIYICDKHGSKPGSTVSRELSAKIALGLRISRNTYIIIRYVYEDELADIFYLDLTTAKRSGLFKDAIMPLPNGEYPDFIKEITMVCSNCREYSLENE